MYIVGKQDTRYICSDYGPKHGMVFYFMHNPLYNKHFHLHHWQSILLFKMPSKGTVFFPIIYIWWKYVWQKNVLNYFIILYFLHYIFLFFKSPLPIPKKIIRSIVVFYSQGSWCYRAENSCLSTTTLPGFCSLKSWVPRVEDASKGWARGEWETKGKQRGWEDFPRPGKDKTVCRNWNLQVVPKILIRDSEKNISMI